MSQNHLYLLSEWKSDNNNKNTVGKNKWISVNISKLKFPAKVKMKVLKFGPKMLYQLRWFWLYFQKTIVIFKISVLEFLLLQSLTKTTFALELENAFFIFEINTIEFVINEFLTYAVNFGIGSAFSEGPVRVRVHFRKCTWSEISNSILSNDHVKTYSVLTFTFTNNSESKNDFFIYKERSIMSLLEHVYYIMFSCNNRYSQMTFFPHACDAFVISFKLFYLFI